MEIQHNFTQWPNGRNGFRDCFAQGASPPPPPPAAPQHQHHHHHHHHPHPHPQPQHKPIQQVKQKTLVGQNLTSSLPGHSKQSAPSAWDPWDVWDPWDLWDPWKTPALYSLAKAILILRKAWKSCSQINHKKTGRFPNDAAFCTCEE